MARQKTNLNVPVPTPRAARPTIKRALKPGSEGARQEGEATRAEAQRILDETVAKQTAAAAQAKQDKLTNLRKQLGIDDLVTSFQDQMKQYQQAITAATPTFTAATPQPQPPQTPATLPTFDFSGVQDYLNKYIAGLTGSESTTAQTSDSIDTTPAVQQQTPTQVTQTAQQAQGPSQAATAQASQAIQAAQPGIPQAISQPAKNINKVTVGGKTYNLAAAGGAGFSKADIQMLQNKGLSTSQIIKAASQSKTAPTQSAQKALGIKVAPTETGGFSITSKNQKSDTQNQPAKQPVFFASPQAASQTGQTKPAQNAATQTKKDAPQASKPPAPAPAPKSAPAPTSSGSKSSGGGGGKKK